MTARWPKLAVRKSRIDGKGLFAGEDIAAGMPIVEYAGERISRKEAATRDSTYHLALDARTVIDAAVDGNEARYANHSCAPNAELLAHKKRAFLIASRDIEKGEEITYDYALVLRGDVDAMTAMLETACSCGAKTCRGTMLREG